MSGASEHESQPKGLAEPKKGLGKKKKVRANSLQDKIARLQQELQEFRWAVKHEDGSTEYWEVAVEGDYWQAKGIRSLGIGGNNSVERNRFIILGNHKNNIGIGFDYNDLSAPPYYNGNPVSRETIDQALEFLKQVRIAESTAVAADKKEAASSSPMVPPSIAPMMPMAHQGQAAANSAAIQAALPHKKKKDSKQVSPAPQQVEYLKQQLRFLRPLVCADGSQGWRSIPVTGDYWQAKGITSLNANAQHDRFIILGNNDKNIGIEFDYNDPSAPLCYNGEPITAYTLTGAIRFVNEAQTPIIMQASAAESKTMAADKKEVQEDASSSSIASPPAAAMAPRDHQRQADSSAVIQAALASEEEKSPARVEEAVAAGPLLVEAKIAQLRQELENLRTLVRPNSELIEVTGEYWKARGIKGLIIESYPDITYFSIRDKALTFGKNRIGIEFNYEEPVPPYYNSRPVKGKAVDDALEFVHQTQVAVRISREAEKQRQAVHPMLALSSPLVSGERSSHLMPAASPSAGIHIQKL